MRHHVKLVIGILLTIFTHGLYAADSPAESEKQGRKAASATPRNGKNAPNPVFEKPSETPGLPRVLLIGDSISMGYTIPVRNLLPSK